MCAETSNPQPILRPYWANVMMYANQYDSHALMANCRGNFDKSQEIVEGDISEARSWDERRSSVVVAAVAAWDARNFTSMNGKRRRATRIQRACHCCSIAFNPLQCVYERPQCAAIVLSHFTHL